MGSKRISLAIIASVAVSAMLVAPVHARSLSSILRGGHGGNSATVSIELSNFATEQAKLRSAISTGMSNGTLNPVIGQQLLRQLDALNAQAQSAAASGALTDQMAWGISDQYNAIQNQLNTAAPAAYNPYANPYANLYASPYARYNPYVNPYANPYAGYNPYGQRFF